MNLYEASQEPFNAKALKRRREEAEKQAAKVAEETGSKKERVRFTNVDFKALVISEGLWTKSAVLAYVQEKGSAEMQRWVGARCQERERARHPRPARAPLDTRFGGHGPRGPHGVSPGRFCFRWPASPPWASEASPGAPRIGTP